MEIRAKGISPEAVGAIVSRVNKGPADWQGINTYRSRTLSDGNVLDDQADSILVSAHTLRHSRNGTTLRVKLGAVSGSPAARQAPGGRNGPWLCWHGFRDVLQAVFDAFPDAVIRTKFITYRGADDFEAKFPETFNGNAGSALYPTPFGELCHNLGWHDWNDR